MSTKRFLAVSVLLAFTTASSLALAGEGISDKRWWPNQTQSAPVSRPGQAMAYAPDITRKPIAPVSAAHQYRGGPRSIH